jgi:hypothetical protein
MSEKLINTFLVAQCYVLPHSDIPAQDWPESPGLGQKAAQASDNHEPCQKPRARFGFALLSKLWPQAGAFG